MRTHEESAFVLFYSAKALKQHRNWHRSTINRRSRFPALKRGVSREFDYRDAGGLDLQQSCRQARRAKVEHRETFVNLAIPMRDAISQTDLFTRPVSCGGAWPRKQISVPSFLL